MKKHLITLITILGLITAPALAGTWVAQSSYGPTCYLVKIPSYGHLIGTGIVTSSGTVFTGYLKATSNPSGYAGTSFPYSSVVNCSSASNQGSCAWASAIGGTSTNSFYLSGGAIYYYSGYSSAYTPAIVYVSGLTITSAQPTACW